MTKTPLVFVVIAAFILGGVAGAVLRPFLTPVEYQGVTVSPAQDGCGWVYSAAKVYPFTREPTTFGDGSGKLACKESMDLLPTVRLTCGCGK